VGFFLLFFYLPVALTSDIFKPFSWRYWSGFRYGNESSKWKFEFTGPNQILEL